MGSGAISVLICTRNRPQDLLRLLRSLLVCPPQDATLQIIVVDQSDSGTTREAVEGLDQGGRVELLCSAVPGKGRALNTGLAVARGDIVVCTDDDCEAPPGWAEAMARTLREQPTAAVLYCQVLAGPLLDTAAGYIPTYPVKQSRLVRRFWELDQLGMGAGMAVRANAVRELGGFDEFFGPGARFPSCDDWDVGIRALLRGWHVYEAKDAHVVHHGLRTWSELRQHMQRDWMAIGAVCAKSLRSGGWTTVPMWARYLRSHAAAPMLTAILSLKLKGSGVGKLVAFRQGFFSAARQPLDRRTLCFAPSTGHGAR